MLTLSTSLWKRLQRTLLPDFITSKALSYWQVRWFKGRFDMYSTVRQLRSPAKTFIFVSVWSHTQHRISSTGLPPPYRHTQSIMSISQTISEHIDPADSPPTFTSFVSILLQWNTIPGLYEKKKILTTSHSQWFFLSAWKEITHTNGCKLISQIQIVTRK